MAHPIGFPQANNILGRPPGVSAEDCASLEVFQNGKQCISRWQLTESELEQLKRNGGKLYLWVWGATQPPIYVSSEDPFTPRAKQ